MRKRSTEPRLVKSAVRAVEVLELFSRERRPLTLSEIIEALGYPQSSTTVMLKSLIAIGYLNYNLQHRTYFPDISVTALGNWISESQLISGPVRALMEEMRARTTESISIAVQNDINVQFLSVVNSDHQIKFFIPSRGQRPLLQSNLGWMLLSTHGDAEIASMYTKMKVADAKVCEFEEVMARVRDIRAQGYSFIPNLPVPGAASVAMLLPCRFHHQPIAIGVGGYVPRLSANLDGILRIMKTSIEKFRPAMAA